LPPRELPRLIPLAGKRGKARPRKPSLHLTSIRKTSHGTTNTLTVTSTYDVDGQQVAGR
jgi:hypothetical protein